MIKLNGIDHKEPIALREEFSKLVRKDLPRQYVVLETCDRVELYSDSGHEGADRMQYQVVRHLFRLASGLESPFLGECQILSQVKKAYMDAVSAKTVSPALHLLFQRALKTGKKVRSETSISIGAVSHGQAAVEILKDKKVEISRSVITLIGVNNLNVNVIRYLMKSGAKTIFLGNRTLEKAEELAEELGCRAFPLNNLPSVLGETDILISATSSPHTIVKKETFPKEKRMIIIDLAVPRDVDEEIGELSGVTLLNIADVESAVNLNRDRRENMTAKAEKIVDEQVQLFMEEMAIRRNNDLGAYMQKS